jgi:hypothetical protein
MIFWNSKGPGAIGDELCLEKSSELQGWIGPSIVAGSILLQSVWGASSSQSSRERLRARRTEDGLELEAPASGPTPLSATAGNGRPENRISCAIRWNFLFAAPATAA